MTYCFLFKRFQREEYGGWRDEEGGRVGGWEGEEGIGGIVEKKSK